MRFIAYHSCRDANLPDYFDNNQLRFGMHSGAMLGAGLYANLDENQVRKGNYGRVLFKVAIDIPDDKVISVTHRGYRMKYGHDSVDILREQYRNAGKNVPEGMPISVSNSGGSTLAQKWYKQFMSDGFKLMIYYGSYDNHSIVCWSPEYIRLLGWSHTSLENGEWHDIRDFSIIKKYENMTVSPDDYKKSAGRYKSFSSDLNLRSGMRVSNMIGRISKPFVLDRSFEKLNVNQNDCRGVLEGTHINSLIFRSSRVNTSASCLLVAQSDEVIMDVSAFLELIKYERVYDNVKSLILLPTSSSKFRKVGAKLDLVRDLKGLIDSPTLKIEGLADAVSKYFPNATMKRCNYKIC